MTRTLRALSCGLVLASACSDGPFIDLPDPRGPSGNPPKGGGDQDAQIAICDQAPDGQPCGLEMHCIFNVCVENTCGDGHPAAGEACDDGNERDDDGCDARCRIEKSPGCGNGIVEPGETCDEGDPAGSAVCTPFCKPVTCGDGVKSPGEECDDANMWNDDQCTSKCKNPTARCGDGRVNGNEECDDGNRTTGDGCEPDCTASTADAGMDAGELDATVPMDGASEEPDDPVDAGPKPDAGPTDAGPKPDAGPRPDAGPDGIAQEIPACAMCRAENCTVYQGLFDLVAGCFDNQDPLFVQQCVDLMDCAYVNDCAYSSMGLPKCFCGTVDLNACEVEGAANGPCQPEHYAAARTTSLPELIASFSDVSRPIGIAFYFVECDRDFCAACEP